MHGTWWPLRPGKKSLKSWPPLTPQAQRLLLLKDRVGHRAGNFHFDLSDKWPQNYFQNHSKSPSRQLQDGHCLKALLVFRLGLGPCCFPQGHIILGGSRAWVFRRLDRPMWIDLRQLNSWASVIPSVKLERKQISHKFVVRIISNNSGKNDNKKTCKRLAQLLERFMYHV